MNTRARLDIALDRLANKYPFHAAVLSGLYVFGDESVGTMGVSIIKDGYEEDKASINLTYAPSFVMRCSLPEIVGVLLHEVHHIIFHHLFMKRESFPDYRALVISQEVTVNEFIKEPLPDGGGIRLEQHPELKPLTSTEERYKVLARAVSKRKGSPKVHDNPVHNSQSQPENSDKTTDNHEVWVVEVDEETAREMVEALLEEAGQKTGVPLDLQQPLTQHGNAVGTATEAIQSRQGAINWRTKLRSYIGSVLERRPVYNRPNRRLPHLIGIVPGSARRPSKPNILGIIDSSISITTELLIKINSELKNLAKEHHVIVVECDTKIQAVYPYHNITEIHGRGGTDFRPPLEAEFLKKHKVDLAIYFTDGMGPAPKEAPKIPLIWCLTPNSRVPASYGKVIKMT